MDKRLEKLLKVIRDNFQDVKTFESLNDGTHITPEGKIISDSQLAEELQGGFTVTIHIMPKTKPA